jgi:hypothetical protein
MRWIWGIAAIAACSTGSPSDTDSASEPTPTPAPAPVPVPVPVPTVPAPTNPFPTTDTDDGSGGGGGNPNDASIRILHAAPGLPSQDLVVNGVLPPTLVDLEWLEATAYVDRAPATYTFQLLNTGGLLADAWTTVDYELLLARRHSFVIYGAPGATDVLRLLDDDLLIDPAMVRIRWTNVATALPSPVTLLETLSGTVLAPDLAYGGTVELDHLPDLMQVGADTDADGVADLVFESFQRSAGEYFHILLVTEEDGTPFLIGQTDLGVTPRRELLP